MRLQWWHAEEPKNGGFKKKRLARLTTRDGVGEDTGNDIRRHGGIGSECGTAWWNGGTEHGGWSNTVALGQGVQRLWKRGGLEEADGGDGVG